MRRYLALILACGLWAPVLGAGLSASDQKALAAFDKEYQPLDKNRAKLGKMAAAMVKRSFDSMRKALASVSPEGRADPGWKERQDKLAGLEAAAAGGSAPATGPTPEEAGILRGFDRDFGQLENAHARAVQPAKARPLFETLKSRLEGLGPAGKEHPSYAGYAARVEAFGRRLAAAEAAEAENARRAAEAAAAGAAMLEAKKAEAAATPRSGPADFAYPDLQALESFDGACRAFPADPFELRKRGAEALEKLLVDLGARLDAMRPELQGLPKLLERRARLARFRAELDEHVLRKIPAPVADPGDRPPTGRAKALLDAFDAAWAARLGGIESPAGLGLHLEARRLLQELRNGLNRAAGELGTTPCLELRQRRYELARFETRIEAAFGGPIHRVEGADETRLKDLRHHLYMARRDQSFGALELQDPARRTLVQETLASLAAELAAIQDPHTVEFLEVGRDLADFKARQEFMIGAADDLARQAPDLDGQLVLIQAQFPMGSFAPQAPDTADPVEIETWARRLRNWKDAVPGFEAFFAKARETSLRAKEPAFAAYASWFVANVGARIDTAARDFGGGFRSRFERGVAVAKDPGSRAEGTAGDLARALGTLDQGIAAGRVLAAFARGWTGAADAAVEAGIDAMAKAKEGLAGGYEAARAARRLSPAGYRDPDLLATAQAILTRGGVVSKGLRLEAAPKAYKGWVVRGDWMYLEAWESFTVAYAAGRDGKWYLEWADLVRDVSKAGKSEWRLNAPPYGLGHEILEENVDEP